MEDAVKAGTSTAVSQLHVGLLDWTYDRSLETYQVSYKEWTLSSWGLWNQDTSTSDYVLVKQFKCVLQFLLSTLV